jgi:acetyl esterase/lipase
MPSPVTGARPASSQSAAQPDPTVQTYLDQRNEGRAPSLPITAEPHGRLIAADMVVFHPRGKDHQRLPALFYLGISTGSPFTRHAALQALADRSGRIVFWQDSGAHEDALMPPVPEMAGLEWVRRHGEHFGADPACLCAAADGIGAIRLMHEICLNPQVPPLRAMFLATPVLGPASAFTFPDNHLRQTHEQMLLDAQSLADKYGWPCDATHARLGRLPPTLVLTAEIDGFRDSGEGFARRLAAIDNDGMAMRCLGAIPDFTWLEPLMDLPVSLIAHQAIATFLGEIAD